MSTSRSASPAPSSSIASHSAASATRATGPSQEQSMLMRARRMKRALAPAALELDPGANADGARPTGDDLVLGADAADHEPGHVVALVEHVLGEQLDAVIAPVIAGEQIDQRRRADPSNHIVRIDRPAEVVAKQRTASKRRLADVRRRRALVGNAA